MKSPSDLVRESEKLWHKIKDQLSQNQMTWLPNTGVYYCDLCGQSNPKIRKIVHLKTCKKYSK